MHTQKDYTEKGEIRTTRHIIIWIFNANSINNSLNYCYTITLTKTEILIIKFFKCSVHIIN